MSESAVKVTVHRLRKRYRKLIRDEIANTLDDPKDVDEEMRYLMIYCADEAASAPEPRQKPRFWLWTEAREVAQALLNP